MSSLSHALPEPLCDVAMSFSPRMVLYTFKYTPNLRVTRDQHRHFVGMNVKWAGNQLGTTKKRSVGGFFFFVNLDIIIFTESDGKESCYFIPCTDSYVNQESHLHRVVMLCIERL